MKNLQIAFLIVVIRGKGVWDAVTSTGTFSFIVKVEAIVREDKYEDVKAALNEIDIYGITVSQVMGCGIQKGYAGIVRGTKVDVNMLPKIKFEIVVPTQEWADKTVEIITKTAYTGNHGDGKIFVYELTDTVRIRTGQHGQGAILE